MNSWSDAKGLGSSEGNSSDWVPSGLNGLSDIDSDGVVGESLNQSIRGPKIYLDFQSDLDTGWGREKLFKYIDNNLEDYSSDETVDLKLYSLDRLDSSSEIEEGVLLGGEAFDYIVEFIDADGDPEFLDGYEVDFCL